MISRTVRVLGPWPHVSSLSRANSARRVFLVSLLSVFISTAAAADEGTIPNPDSAGGTIPNPASAGGPIPTTSNLNVPLSNGSGDSSSSSQTPNNSPAATNSDNPTSSTNSDTPPSSTNSDNPTATSNTNSDTPPANGTNSDNPTGSPQAGTPTGQTEKVYATAYSGSEKGTDADTAAGLNAQGGQLEPGQVAVDPSVIPYGTKFTVDNPQINQAALADGAPNDGAGHAIFTATDTGSAVKNGTAAAANGYAGTPVVDFYASNASAYQSLSNAASTPLNITILGSHV